MILTNGCNSTIIDESQVYLKEIHQNLKTMEQRHAKLDRSKFNSKFECRELRQNTLLFQLIHDKVARFMMTIPSISTEYIWIIWYVMYYHGSYAPVCFLKYGYDVNEDNWSIFHLLSKDSGWIEDVTYIHMFSMIKKHVSQIIF